MAKASLQGTFKAKNPNTGEVKSFNLAEMGYVSATATFHFSPRKPAYAHEAAWKYIQVHFPFVKNAVGRMVPAKPTPKLAPNKSAVKSGVSRSKAMRG